MKYLDVIVQTILISAVALVVPAFSNQKLDWAILILFIQMLLGPWQIASSIVYQFTKLPFRGHMKLHLVLSAFYLLILYASGNTSSPVFDLDSTPAYDSCVVVGRFQICTHVEGGCIYETQTWKISSQHQFLNTTQTISGWLKRGP